jgi:hypothetical protein
MGETVILDVTDRLVEFEKILWNGTECGGKKLK